MFSNGHLRRTVIIPMVRPAQPSWLSETLVLRVSIFSKCPLMDIYDGPSYSRRSVLHSRHDGDLPPKGLHTFSKCPTTDIDDVTSLSQRSVLLAHHHYQRLSFRGLHINIVEVRHNGHHDGSSYSRRAVTWSIVFHRVSLLL